MTKPKNKNASPALDDAPLVKAEEMDDGYVGDEGDDDDDEDEDEDEDAMTMKSDLTEATLLKALDDMDTLVKATSNGVSPRQTALGAKLSRGEILTKSEREELVSLADDASLEKSHKESFMEDQNLKSGFEVSEFLDALASKITDSLDANRAELAKSAADTGEFNKSMARAVNALGSLVLKQEQQIKSLSAKLEKSLGAPVAAEPRGRTTVGTKVNEGLVKSGTGTQGVVLSKSVILDTFDTLIAKSEGQVVDGVDLLFESTRYESTNMASPDAMRLICKERGIDPAALGIPN